MFYKRKKMSDTIKAAVIQSIVAIAIFLLGNFFTQYTIEKSTVKTLANYFDSVDKDMSYEDAMKALRTEINNKNLEIKNLKKRPDGEYKNASLISDGLKIQDNIPKSVIIVGNENYYSTSVLNMFLNNKISYNALNNTIYYSSTGQSITKETKIALSSTNVLYDGTNYKKYLPSESDTFSMGSQTYNDGFVIYDDHSLFGEGDGFALFDLQGKYSKMSFTIGRTNEYEKENVTLKVYLDNRLDIQYSLNGSIASKKITINLKKAKNLKLEISGGTRVIYGFTDIYLYY